MARTITEAAKEIEVYGEYDVVVAGGGPAGVCAGLSAARSGFKTLLIEQMSCMGGTATAGMHRKIAMYHGAGGAGEIVGGIPKEIAQRAVRDHEADYHSQGLFIQIENFKFLLDAMAEESGLGILYFTQVADTLVEDGKVRGIIFNNKSGRFAVLAGRVIDCTGDADVAFRAGCRMMHGRDEDHKMQPVTLMYLVGGVDNDKVREYRDTQDRSLVKFCKRAAEEKLMRPFQTNLMGFWYNSRRPTELNINFTHMHLDGSSAFDMTVACIEGRKQVQEAVRAMRRLIPGLENSYLITSAPYVGIRETRRVYGEYVLTADDIKNLTIFDDSIGLGSAFIDIHNVDGPGMDKKSGYHLPKGKYYSIPYRTLVPEEIENLLVAGRCHSATHEAAGSTRWMTQCMIMGQAAGTASAVSIEESVPPRDVNRAELQERLKKDGAVLS